MFDWEEKGEGSLVREAPGGRVHVVEPTHDGWNLFTIPSRSDPGAPRSPDFFWFDRDFDDLLAVATACDGFWIRRDASSLLPDRTLTREFDGHRLTASFRRGSFSASVWSPGEDREIGRYFGGLNNCLSGFVTGRLTIQGSRHVDERLRGRGFGNALIDIAEEVTGLIALPHGYLGTTGVLSEAADRSWQGRWRRNGMTPLDQTPDVSMRAEGMAASRTHGVMRFGWDDYRCGVELASRMGLGLTTISTPKSRSGDGFFPSSTDAKLAFATREDGSVISLRGLSDIDQAVAHNLWLARDEADKDECTRAFIAPEDIGQILASISNQSGFYLPNSAGAGIAEAVVSREQARGMKPVLPGMAF